jgi:hypothetical protein
MRFGPAVMTTTVLGRANFRLKKVSSLEASMLDHRSGCDELKDLLQFAPIAALVLGILKYTC